MHKQYTYILKENTALSPAGTIMRLWNDCRRSEIGLYLLCDGRELWAADYPDLAKKCKRTILQRLRGVFVLPDLN